MNRNIEIKARMKDFRRTQEIAESLADGESLVLSQEDTFFQCKSGRLKLRVFSDTEGELICYERPDIIGPKQSRYMISRTCEPHTLREALSSALDILGTIRKTRLLYMIGQTRVHLDTVEGLGAFIELEVVLQPQQTEEDGRMIADRLAALLQIQEDDLVPCAYIDLIRNAPAAED